MQPNLLESSSLSDVQYEILKMTKVVKEIETVLGNILESSQLNKIISWNIFQSLHQALTVTVSTLSKFPKTQEQNKSFSKKQSVFSKISQCQDEEEQEFHQSRRTVELHSQLSYENELFQSKLSLLNHDVTLLRTKNQQLKQENEYLTDKLAEAEKYIKKIQEINEGLLRQEYRDNKSNRSSRMNFKHIQSHASLKHNQSKTISDLIQQIQKLKQQLKQSQQFITRSNEQFIKQIHKKNQKVWRLQNQLQSYKNRISQTKDNKSEQQFLINKLKEQNFKLQVQIRNMKINSTPIKTNSSQKSFQKMLKNRVSTAISLDIQGALNKKKS